MTTPAKKRGGRTVGTRVLTPRQKAEAVALWRGGEVTLATLALKFKKRPETFSRMFKRMGIEKGASVKEAAAKMEAAAIAAAVGDTEETVRRIKVAKDEHYKMANGLAKLAWGEIVRARLAHIPLDKLKEVMATLKLAGDVIGNARKELYTILQVEEHDKKEDESDLPELMVRELTTGEVKQLQDAPDLDEDGVDMGLEDPTEDVLGLDLPEDDS